MNKIKKKKKRQKELAIPFTCSPSLYTSNESSSSQFEILMGRTFDSLHSKSALGGQ